MPTDLNGTPTSLGIGTYETSTDPPSGLGFNEAMNQIDALIAARMTAPASPTAGDVPVWNGTTWVRSSTTRIDNGGSALPKITTSPASGGPPASPSDGDIWIATGVDANETRWQFQYNASSASVYKWDFVGGAPTWAESRAFENISSGSTWVAGTSPCTLSVPRDGDYLITASMLFVSSGSAENHVFLGVMYNGGNPSQDVSEAHVQTSGFSGTFTVSNTIKQTFVDHTHPLFVAAYQDIGNLASQMSYRSLTVWPIRVM